MAVFHRFFFLFLLIFLFGSDTVADDRKIPSEKLRDYLGTLFDPPLRVQVEGQHNIRFRTLNDATPAAFKPKLIEAKKRYLVMELASEKDGVGYIEFGNASRRFRVYGDRNYHIYNIDLHTPAKLTGFASKFQFIDQPNVNLRLKRLEFADEPQGKAEVEILSAGLTEAVNYPREEREFFIHVRNHGGTESGELSIAQFNLPPQVTPVDGANYRKLGSVPPQEFRTFTFQLKAQRHGRRAFQLKLTGEGAPREIFRGTLEFDEKSNLPASDYVPVPRPPTSNYEIGAFYSPNWLDSAGWENIVKYSPERKPVLGFYDENDPVNIDWNIKYMVENGISFLLIDWFDGKTESWIEAYDQARYRNLLKWALVWNDPVTTAYSLEKHNATMETWLEYFKKDYYYKIDGKPVILIGYPDLLRKIPGEQTILELSQDRARSAGFPGIYFIAVHKGPLLTDKKAADKESALLKKEGYAMTATQDYHAPGAKRSVNKYLYDYRHVVEGTYEYFLACQKYYPFLPVISTGYDNFPDQRDAGTSVVNRTPEEFLRLCREVKRFADRTGQKRMVFTRINMWNEGTNIAPNREYGFKMYEAIRDTFCNPPAGGWPLNYGPEAVGLAAPQWKIQPETEPEK